MESGNNFDANDLGSASNYLNTICAADGFCFQDES